MTKLQKIQTILDVPADDRWGDISRLALNSEINASALRHYQSANINTIVDIYHGNNPDFDAMKAGGIVAVIHKATQGVGIQDSTYIERRRSATMRGLLWGCYHFSTGESVTDQVDNFLFYANPSETDLVSLDWEPSTSGNMTLDQAERFCQQIHDRLGRWPMVYGGSLLREEIGVKKSEVLSQCPLWYVRYNDAPIGIPSQVWPGGYTLWQYSDGDAGPEPRSTPGCHGADRNRFDGSEADLRSRWPLS